MAKKSFLKRLDNKKVRMFSLFLVFSFISWTISKLSQSYDSWVAVDLRPVNLPDSLFLGGSALPQSNIKVRTNGFRMLSLGIRKAELKIDISKAVREQSGYYLSKERLLRQLQERLSGSAEVLDVDSDQIYFDLYEVISKKVPVLLNLDLRLSPNYILQGKLKVRPDSIELKGRSAQLDTIGVVKTMPTLIEGVTGAFKVDAALELIDQADLQASQQSVAISGEVVRFSEKVFEVPIEVVNVPQGYSVRLFPKSVSVLCKASETALNGITQNDFKVVAHIDSFQTKSKQLRLQLDQKPQNSFSVRLLNDSVEFLLEPK